ncbi:hypothetical protein P154DRAFT_621089 [Amniculicola lignicola CBS 123094]|uniref:Carbohydrate-binding module family 18 protein n=1 Tax=Amniculicola lignicola CBS 123094 TaxID=1392246 RepID=A0A6A5WJC7_9PLEO|nr:hypothetical protein P154DRAFT_621089 [Amniculicola lignicola CBS 123094]
MLFHQIVIIAFAAFAAASPVPEESIVDVTEALAANCNDSIGNCYSNGCNGNPTTLVCLSGAYTGCPCGYDCNGRGPCNGNGCEGRNGRCTANFLGCACG